MTDNNDAQQTEEQPQTRRGRPPRGKTRRKFAAELASLQARVDMAVRLLRRVTPGDAAGANNELVSVAIQTLQEDA